MPQSINEFRGEFSDIMVITELRGAFPNVPIAADVDYAALVAGDADPQFLTIPIGKVNVKSRNDRYYGEDFALEVMRQTLTNKPIGLMGHLSEAERANAFPKESLHWVGAIRDGDLIWGKAYLIGEGRERVRRYKASGKSIATSIDAYASGKWDESLKAHRMDAATLRLNQIDLVPADRAGIPDLAAIPMLTTEMDAPGKATEQEYEMSKEEVIKELVAVKVPPNKGWQAPAQAQEVAATEATEVTEIREMLGANDTADLKQMIRELYEEREANKRAIVANRITELVNEGIKLQVARGIVTKFIKAALPKTVEEAESAYQQVVEMAEIKELLQVTAQSLSGPAAIVNGKVRETGRKPLEDTPENRQRAAAAMGINI